MTAVIGILNKTAVAIAADSAVTVSDGNQNSKVYNTANKIFQLSKYQPVGLVIYNSASFVQTPWEIIIKMYRDNLGEKTFNTVKEYQQDFVSYIEGNLDLLAPDAGDNSFESLLYSLFEDLLTEVSTQIPKDSNSSVLSTLVEQILRDILGKRIISSDSQVTSSSHLNNWNTSGHKDIYQEKSDDFIRTRLTDLNITESDLVGMFTEYVFVYLESDHVYASNYSGLVFVGYGIREIYPVCEAIEVAEVLGRQVRYVVRESVAITNQNPAQILPFAQRDVIDTVISGVAPDLQAIYTQAFIASLSMYNEQLEEVFRKAQFDQIADLVKNLDLQSFIHHFEDRVLSYQKQAYIYPTVSTTAMLSKEDLAEMAESLIYLTFLKRRFTAQEESVGGPVDVAVISKGEGFIWIKRKFYFDPSLNPHFFKTYFAHKR